MNRFTSFASLAILMCGAAACGSAPDVERDQLRGTIRDSRVLADEILTWRTGISGDIAVETNETIEGFQERAEELKDELEDYSDDAMRGTDTTGLLQALVEITEFDYDPMTEASQTARVSLLDQFHGLARNLRTAATNLSMP